jgi:hypothetical protein
VTGEDHLGLRRVWRNKSIFLFLLVRGPRAGPRTRCPFLTRIPGIGLHDGARPNQTETRALAHPSRASEKQTLLLPQTSGPGGSAAEASAATLALTRYGANTRAPGSERGRCHRFLFEAPQRPLKLRPPTSGTRMRPHTSMCALGYAGRGPTAATWGRGVLPGRLLCPPAPALAQFPLRVPQSLGA